jgi:tetratricopeptide (TPR) repeat protein
MYGHIKKCSDLIDIDNRFLEDCDKTFKNRKEAAAHMIARGWRYFYAKKYDTAMMRFNQAWLLDSLNSQIYWGFGDLLGLQRKFKESLALYKRSIKIDSAKSTVWEDMSISYGNIFFESKEQRYLDSSIQATRQAIKIDPHNAAFYGELAADYSYFIQKDSAKKYLKIAEQMNPNVVNPEVKKLLGN